MPARLPSGRQSCSGRTGESLPLGEAFVHARRCERIGNPASGSRPNYLRSHHDDKRADHLRRLAAFESGRCRRRRCRSGRHRLPCSYLLGRPPIAVATPSGPHWIVSESKDVHRQSENTTLPHLRRFAICATRESRSPQLVAVGIQRFVQVVEATSQSPMTGRTHALPQNAGPRFRDAFCGTYWNPELAHPMANWFRSGSSLKQSKSLEHLNRLVGFRRAMATVLEF